MMETKIIELQKSFNSINESLKSINESIDNCNATINNIDKSLDSLENTLDEGFINIQQKIKDIKNTMKRKHKYKR
jgi:prefoldin subunit 5